MLQELNSSGQLLLVVEAGCRMQCSMYGIPPKVHPVGMGEW